MKKKSTPPHWKVGEKDPHTEIRTSHTLEGVPVIDATTPLLLEIKKPDITGSTKASPGNCAAARALKRTMGTEARVFLTRTYVKIGKKWQRFITPHSISREIVAFDRGAHFEPGEYTLRAPGPGQQLGHYRANGPGKKNGTSTRPRHVTANVRKMK